MKKKWANVLLLVVAAAGCRSASAPRTERDGAAPIVAVVAPDAAEAEDAATAVAASEPAAVDAGTANADSCDPSRAPAPLRELPCLVFADMPRVMGFTKKGDAIGYCVSPDDQGLDVECGVLSLAAGTERRLHFRADPRRDADEDGASSKEQQAKIDAFVRTHGLTAPPAERTLGGPFPFDDVAFVVTTVRDDARDLYRVSIGAHAAGEPPVFPLSLVVGPHPMRRRLPASMTANEKTNVFAMRPPIVWLDVRSDGAEIGAVVFAPGDGFHEEAHPLHLATRRFVAQVYREEAKLRAKQGDTARAAELDAKAARAAAGT